MNENIADNLEKHGFIYIEDLGTGGFGTVVKVKHKISNQYFAVKKLNSKHKENPENILREIKAIAIFNNPFIISYNYSFIEDDELYLVMEYCENGSLRDLLSKENKLLEAIIKT
jgi:serine/threonine protein kinase